MPRVDLPIVVDAQNSIGAAIVYINMDIPRPRTIDHPPNYAWTYSDANGHWHTYDAKGETPTLYAIRGPGSIEYHCKICDELIVPATLPDPINVIVNIHPHWATRVTLATLPGNRVTVRATTPGQPTNFGLAFMDGYTGTGPYVVDLIGEAPIAVMQA